MENKDWLKKKYFHIGNTLVSAEGMLNIFQQYLSEFDCSMITNKLFRYYPRGEQISRILKEFAKQGFLMQKNTLDGERRDGRKKALYIYKLNQQHIMNKV